MPESLVYNVDCLEEFRSVNEYYLVSNYGRIVSLKTNKFLKPITNGSGYAVVSIDGTMKTIHRLVATAFLPKILSKMPVNHKDGNKLNNHVSNLEWCTYSQNIKHAYDTGLRNTTKAVDRYDINGVFEKRYKSARDAEKDGYSNQNIAHCCNNKRKLHLGKMWKYADQ